MIRHLPASVRACIRTGVALTSFAQAVEELVLNSVDAGATSIAIRVDFSCFKVQVVDNGIGISLDQFQLIGERYSTSKCHTVQDLENLRYFGYRGEALASLRSAASFLEIVSRSRSSVITYSKCFQNGNVLDVIQASLPRPSAGTTVTAHDLFYNLPVRRQRVNGVLEMEKIRYRLAGIALMWPQISFSLRDDSTGHVILQTHKCSGIGASFSSIFTPARTRGLMEVSAERDEFKLSGIVSKESYSRMDLQFVFVNKRLVLKSSIHRQINKIFGRSLILRRKGFTNDMLEKNVSAGGAGTGSPQKQIERYAIFAINVECPYSAYDITFDPSKTLVEFRDWPKLINLLQDMLYGFMRKENLLSATEPTASASPYDLNYEDDNDGYAEDEDENCNAITNSENNVLTGEKYASLPVAHKFGRSMSTVIENGLFSKPVHRQNTVKPIDLLVAPEQKKYGLDQCKIPQAKTSIEQSQPNVHVEEDTTLNGNKECNANNNLTYTIYNNGCSQKESVQTIVHARNAIAITQENKTDMTRYVGQGTAEKTAGNNILQIPSSCQLSSDCEDVSSESFSVKNRKHLREDSEEVIVKGQTPFIRQKITLGNLVHYSSTLQNLRDIRQTSSSSSKPEIITNTLQQLKKSTQKTVKNLEYLYKTPENPATSNENKGSPPKRSKMEDVVKTTNINNPTSKHIEATLKHSHLKAPVLNESLITCKNKYGNSNLYGLIEHNLNNTSTNLAETTTLDSCLNEHVNMCKSKLKTNCSGKTIEHHLCVPSTKSGEVTLLGSHINEPVFSESVNTYKSKYKNDFSHSTEEENYDKQSTSHIDVNNIGGSDEIRRFCGESNSLTKFTSSHEDRSLGLNDRVIGLKRTFNHKTSHASKLAKLMRGEKVAAGPQETCNNDDLGLGSLSAFSYNKLQRHAHFKHSRKDILEPSNCIPDVPFISGAQNADKHSNGDMFKSTTDIFPEYLSVDRRKETIISNDRERWRGSLQSSESLERPQTSSSATPCNECYSCKAVCHAKKQPDQEKNGLPFSIYKKTEDIVALMEVEKSPKVSVILSLPLESGISKMGNLKNLNRQAPTGLLNEENNLFNQSRCNNISENDREHNINFSKPRNDISANETAVIPHLSTQGIKSRNNHGKGVQEVMYNSTSQSLTDKELVSQEFHLSQEHLPTPCQTGAEENYCRNNISTPVLSQGFTVNLHLDNNNSESTLEGDSSSCLLQSSNSISNVEKSPTGFDSAGFSPTNDAASTTDEDSLPHAQSKCAKNLMHCPENNAAGIHETGISPLVLSDSDTDIYIQNSRDNKQKDNTLDIFNNLSVSSIEGDSDIQRENVVRDTETHYSLNSGLTLSSVPVSENQSIVNVVNSTAATKTFSHHMFESISNQDSLASGKPVILAYDSLKDFDTVPETEDMENSELDKMENNVADIDSVFSKGDSKGVLNSACSEDKYTAEVKNIIANAKQILRNMQKSFGIADSTQDPCNSFNNNEKTTVTEFQNESAFDQNHSSDIYPRNIIQAKAYTEIASSGKNYSRTFIQPHTSDCGQNLLHKPEENRMHQDSSNWNIMSTSSSDIIENDQRSADIDIAGIKNKQESTETIIDTHIGNDSKNLSALEPDISLEIENEHVTGSKSQCSQTDQLDMVSRDGDQVMMMIDEPVLSPAREAETVKSQACNSHIGLSSYTGIITAGVKSDIVSSSLSLLRQAELVGEPWKTPSHQDRQQSNDKDGSSTNANAEVRPVSSNQNSVALAQESYTEKAGVDQDKQMVEIDPAKNMIVDKSPCNQETVASQEEKTKIAHWKEVTDPETGKKMYINNLSGHTVSDKQWSQMSSQTQREMLAIPSECTIAATVKGPAVLSASQKQLFKDLVSGHFEQEEKEAVSKWRKGERPVYDKTVEADVSDLLARWTNPVFLPYKQPGLLAEMLPSGTVARSCFRTLSSVEFTKSMLGTVKVIGQLDNKFIACVIDKPPDFSKAITSKSNDLLVLFDQHAVHERVRLEHLTEEAYEIENGEKTDRIKRSEIKPPQTITMDQDDLRIVKAFKQEFHRIGVCFTVDKSSRNILHVSSLPSCMVEKDTSELKKKKVADVIDSVENLIKEHIELLKSTNGACGRLPLVIHKLLCSQACHGAVKFGDKLTLQDCQNLLFSLATCSLPFQCAHGRPSIAPLVSLSALEKELHSATRPPNLWKISQNMKE